VPSKNRYSISWYDQGINLRRCFSYATKNDYTNVKNIYIIFGKTDMRKGIDGLATLIQDSFDLI
jgi:hypothetical protein